MIESSEEKKRGEKRKITRKESKKAEELSSDGSDTKKAFVKKAIFLDNNLLSM